MYRIWTIWNCIGPCASAPSTPSKHTTIAHTSPAFVVYSIFGYMRAGVTSVCLYWYLRIHAHFPVMFWRFCLPTTHAIYGKQYISQLVNKCEYGACTWLMLAEHFLVNISTRTACRLPRNAHWSFCQAFLWMADVTGIALVSCCRLSPILWAFAAIVVDCWYRCVRISTCGFWSVVNWITSKSTYSYPPWRL